MLNKHKIISPLIAAAALSAGIQPAQSSNINIQRKDKPNVIFILVDDLSYFAVGAYGMRSMTGTPNHFKDEVVETPNIDRLAGQGMLCSHAYAHALSEATRVALMTGMNNERNFLVPKALHESQITFADVFQQNGYVTGMYGKWKQSRGTKENPAARHLSSFGWDDYACFDMVTANQRFINPDLVINDKVVSYVGRTDLDPETGRRWFGPDIFNRKALQFIETNKDKPFFLYYPMVLIHDDHKPTPDSTPKEVFNTIGESNKVDSRKHFTDMVRYADKMVGRVVDKVEELGLRDNTLIVFMGDNGSKEFVYFNMEDGTVHRGGKGQTVAKGERVPLIFSMPGTIPAGSNGEQRAYAPAVDVTDIYPTLLQATGLELPENANKIDGVGLWSQIKGDKISAHRDNIYKWYNANFKQTDKSLAVSYAQTPDFKYYAPHDAYPEGRFFDLRTDPHETHGKQGRKLGYEKFWYTGLDLKKLDKEQKAAYEELKAVVERHAFTPVESIAILDAPKAGLKVGESYQLKREFKPANATRNGSIWHSSAPEVVSVDKFGRLKAHKKGEATITLYSWDDAWPIAIGAKGGYKTDGMNDKINLIVR